MGTDNPKRPGFPLEIEFALPAERKGAVLRNTRDSNGKRKEDLFFPCSVKMWNLKNELLKLVIKVLLKYS